MDQNGSTDTARSPAAMLLRLSTREHEIVVLLGDGCSVAEISSRLGIARGTVRTHLRRAMHKLRAADRIQLMTILGSITHESPREGEDDLRPHPPVRSPTA